MSGYVTFCPSSGSGIAGDFPTTRQTSVSSLCFFDIYALPLAQVRETHDTLRKKRLDEFMTGFNSISLKLKEMYQMITLGGDAELELVDSLDPFSEVNCVPFNRQIS
jgi:hypothetical protein